MPIIIPDIIVESVLREGFKILRENDAKFDDWFGSYKEYYLTDQYGQATINKLRTYVKENQIPVLQAYSDIPSKIPCLTISPVTIDEAQEDAFLGDYGYTEDVTTDPTTIAEGLTISTYDSSTGYLKLDPSSVIDNVYLKHLVRDGNGLLFSIYSIIDEAGQKWINIGPGMDIDTIDTIDIVDRLNFYRDRYLVVPVRHRLMVNVHTEDAFMTKNLLYLVIYILLSEKPRLMKRGIELSTWNVSEFSRDDYKLPEHIYTRSLDMNFITFFSWLDARDRLASDFRNKVRVEKDIYPRPDGDIFTVDTVEDDDE